MVPGLQAAIDGAIAEWQPQVDAFCKAIWTGAFLAGIERGAIWGFVAGVVAGFLIHRSLLKSLSDAHAIKPSS